MIAVQKRLSQKIPGFRFNLGFSGRSFKQGDNEEDEGDDSLIEHAHEFTWFGHLYDHEQPHKHTYQEIVTSLNRNEEFAKVPNLILDISVLRDEGARFIMLYNLLRFFNIWFIYSGKIYSSVLRL